MFLALLSAYLLSQFYRAFLAVVAGDLGRDLGLDAAALGSLAAAWFLAFASLQIPIGIALDRFGPRRTLAIGMVPAIVGAAWLAASRGYVDALGAMALIGAGCAPVLMAGFYVIARSYPFERFAALSSLLLGLGSLGDPLSGAPLAFVAGTIGWRGALAVMAGLTAASAVAVAAFLRDPPRAFAPDATASRLAGIREVIGTRALWPILPLALVSYAAVISTRGLWIAPYLEKVHGLSADARSNVATAMGVAIAGGALLYAPLASWFGGIKRTIATGALTAGLFWAALGGAGASSTSFAVVALLAAGCLGSPYALMMAHARSFLPAHLVGLGVTLMNLVFMGGVAAGQWLSGRYVQAGDIGGLGADVTFSRLFTAFGAVVIASAVIYLVAAPRERSAAA